ncbi:MAG TPA: hypothetical protein VFI65_09375 [Streptosporangiaceae bacterium]|nr:hypothetical protein [Streptosporangiaceae bacterium]
MVTDGLTTLFSDVAQQLEPDLAAMIDEAIRRGRRMKARRRIAIALSAGATVLTVAVATAFGAQLAGSSSQGPEPASHHGHRATKPKPKPKPHHAAALPQVAQEHGPGMTGAEMLAVLRTLLPAGEITYVDPTQSRGDLEINFDDGSGAVDIQLSATPTGAAYGGDPTDCPYPPVKDEAKRPAGALPISCTTVTLRNGDIIRKGVTAADFAGFYDIQLYMTRPDGVDVSIAVANGTLEGTPHDGRQGWPWVDRAVPPGSVDFWQRVILSPKWHL